MGGLSNARSRSSSIAASAVHSIRKARTTPNGCRIPEPTVAATAATLIPGGFSAATTTAGPAPDPTQIANLLQGSGFTIHDAGSGIQPSEFILLNKATGLALTDHTGTCTDLMNQYTIAYAQAQVCDPTAANQCQQPVQGPNCLGNCGALVQNPTAADAIVTKMINLGCAHPLACPCAAPQTYSCAPADGGGGTCQGSFAAPQ